MNEALTPYPSPLMGRGGLNQRFLSGIGANPSLVIPAQAGIQNREHRRSRMNGSRPTNWIPACAGMTGILTFGVQNYLAAEEFYSLG